MNFEHGEYATNPEESISGDDGHCWSEEDTKLAWMRETEIRIFKRMELKACLDEVACLVRCHNCAANIFSEAEYPQSRTPIPPNYIDNLQSRLVKVEKGV